MIRLLLRGRKIKHVCYVLKRYEVIAELAFESDLALQPVIEYILT